MRRAVLAGVVLAICTAFPAAAQVGPKRVAIVVIIDGSSLPDLLAVPQLRALASRGGSALMNGRTPVRESLIPKLDLRDVRPLPLTNHGIDLRGASPAEAAAAVRDFLADHPQPTLAMIVSASPSAASAADGDELGAVIAAWGDPDELLRATGEPKALTSDSTRRVGVVATVDPAATVAEWLDLPYDAGAPIHPTDEPAPLDLYERYMQQRRLAVPVAATSWTVMGLAGVAGLLALRSRRRVSERTLAAAAALVASLPWLALALLLVGHLPSLTPWTVIPFLVLVTAVGVALTRTVAARRGILVAIAVAGAVILLALALEAFTGWTAAVTPLAGGGQLDGGRFFGMPNAEIGLVLGAGLYVAQRLRTAAGVALLAVCALVTGSPWTGSNVGSAITLFATAGLWWGVRSRRRWWIVAIATTAITTLGMVAVSVMHRYLTARPTHVTAFLEQTTDVIGAIEHLVARLRIGLDLLAASPFSIVPVLGTIILLVVVLRPPAPVAASFEARDRWRDAVFVILLGSVVAYLANDTGAAALGFGFGTALSGLLDVSLTTAREKMTR